jgi:mono/diheme cytochrome c family protein
MDELLQQVAELRGMPASLVERSAQARADKTGATVEEVLQEWAGEAGAGAVGEAAQDVDAETEAIAIDAATSAVAETEGTGPMKDDGPSAAADEAIPEGVTTDRLVKLAADVKRMPPRLILSSATARSEHSDASLDEVLADWAGVDLEDLRKQASTAPAAEPAPSAVSPQPSEKPSAEEAPEAIPAAVVVAGAMTMDQLLEKVADVKGMPASLAKRSAEARSKKTGEPVEAVLAEWAGVEVADLASETTADTQVSTVDVASIEDASDESMETDADADDGIEIIEASPEEAIKATGQDEPVAAGKGRYPIWLAAAFVLIPLLAVTYILVAPNGPECGTAGQLLVDPVTGETTNCDGTEYGVTTVDYFAQGEGLYSQCVACHSADGSGGAGPAFQGGAVLATFPDGSCSTHIEWIRVGTAGWPDPTYGTPGKPVGGFGLMPAFGGTMSDEQLASVALYERVAFGGQPLDQAEADCGLADPEDGESASTEAAGS